MGVLDFIFGNKDDDDLEAASTSTETDKPLTIENVPFFQRPIGASENDIMVGFDEAGNYRYRTGFGTEYTVKLNPDQRTINQKIKDAVPVVTEAVTDYVKDPYLPSKEAVKNFAYDSTVGAVNELDRIMFSGEATYGDVFGLGLGMGGAPRVINKVVDIAPDGDQSSTLGMFLPAAKLKDGKVLVDQANQMKAAGSTRDEIWEKTGLWQLGDAEEWLTEIPDNKAEIALTINDAPPQTKTVTQTVRRQVGGAGLSQGEIIQAKTRARMEAIKLRSQAERGEVPPEFVESEIARIQAELSAMTGGAEIPEYEDVEITKEVPIPKPKLTKGNSSTTSTLDEVLFHDDFFDTVRASRVTNMDDLPTAEAGRRKAKSAGASSAGAAYPDTLGGRRTAENKKQSLISAYTEGGDYINSPQNERDKSIVADMASGKITEQQARSKLIFSTFLHEVQHWSDSIFDSKSGVGFNSSNSSKAKSAMESAFERSINNAFLDNDATGTRLATVLNSTPSNAIYTNRIKELDLSNFAPTMDDLLYGRGGDYFSDGKRYTKDDITSISGILNRFYAYRMANTQVAPEMIEQIRLDFINSLARSKQLKDVPYAKKGTDEDLYFRQQKAELILRILESDEGMALYNPYMQIVQGKTANIRNLSDREIYALEMGEAKARLVEARRDMTPEELKNTPPWLMLDRDEWKLWNENQYGMK
jgi:hypothetical protein